MTDRELMQMANRIEALAFEMKAPNSYTPQFVMLANEIRARARLAQPEPQPVATLFGSLPVYDVPPEQEPVAWMHNFIDEVVIAHRPVDLDRHPDRWTALYKDPTSCQTCEALARTVMMDQTSHDTPPQREWQGLTDEEYEAMAEHYVTNFYFDTLKYARAIEAKLKEKNNG